MRKQTNKHTTPHTSRWYSPKFPPNNPDTSVRPSIPENAHTKDKQIQHKKKILNQLKHKKWMRQCRNDAVPSRQSRKQHDMSWFFRLLLHAHDIIRIVIIINNRKKLPKEEEGDRRGVTHMLLFTTWCKQLKRVLDRRKKGRHPIRTRKQKPERLENTQHIIWNVIA